MYEKEGGVAPEPITKLSWKYAKPHASTPEEMAKESNGYALADWLGKDGKIIRKKVNYWTASTNCVMTVQQNVRLGFSRVRGHKYVGTTYRLTEHF